MLGSKEIISEILSDFEYNYKIGIIFPEAYYKVLISYNNEVTKEDKYYINYLVKKLSKSLEIGTEIEFPVGNMFWARIDSIHQIFSFKINNIFPKEDYQIDGTIMHGIERFWVYLAKFNGFYYKKIFKHL